MSNLSAAKEAFKKLKHGISFADTIPPFSEKLVKFVGFEKKFRNNSPHYMMITVSPLDEIIIAFSPPQNYSQSQGYTQQNAGMAAFNSQAAADNARHATELDKVYTTQLNKIYKTKKFGGGSFLQGIGGI